MCPRWYTCARKMHRTTEIVPIARLPSPSNLALHQWATHTLASFAQMIARSPLHTIWVCINTHAYTRTHIHTSVHSCSLFPCPCARAVPLRETHALRAVHSRSRVYIYIVSLCTQLCIFDSRFHKTTDCAELPQFVANHLRANC